jgi:hypothetical protein
VSQDTRQGEPLADCVGCAHQITPDDLARHDRDIEIRRADPTARTFAVASMFTQQQFQRALAVGTNLLGVALNNHPLFS